MADLKGIWLEVSNLRFDPSKGVEVQLKGDRADKEQEWWPIEKAKTENNDEIQRKIFEGLDKKRLVLVKLTPNKKGKKLLCSQIRIQHTEPGNR